MLHEMISILRWFVYLRGIQEVKQHQNNTKILFIWFHSTVIGPHASSGNDAGDAVPKTITMNKNNQQWSETEFNHYLAHVHMNISRFMQCLRHKNFPYAAIRPPQTKIHDS